MTITPERLAEIRGMVSACSYVGRCNSSRCPEHGYEGVARRDLLTALDEVTAEVARLTMERDAAIHEQSAAVAAVVAERDALIANSGPTVTERESEMAIELVRLTAERDAALDAATARAERAENIVHTARWAHDNDSGPTVMRAILDGNGLQDGIAEDMQSDLDRVTAERDGWERSYADACRHHRDIEAERDDALARVTAAEEHARQLDGALVARIAERDALSAERDAALASRDQYQRERDAAGNRLAAMLANPWPGESWPKYRAKVTSEMDTLRAERDAVLAALEAERLESSSWRATARDKGESSRAAAAERDAALAALAMLHAKAEAVRSWLDGEEDCDGTEEERFQVPLRAALAATADLATAGARVIEEAEERAFMEGVRQSAESIDRAADDPIHQHRDTLRWAATILRAYLDPNLWTERTPPPLARYRAQERGVK
jgi:chromosome segregation protein